MLLVYSDTHNLSRFANLVLVLQWVVLFWIHEEVQIFSTDSVWQPLFPNEELLISDGSEVSNQCFRVNPARSNRSEGACCVGAEYESHSMIILVLHVGFGLLLPLVSIVQ